MSQPEAAAPADRPSRRELLAGAREVTGVAWRASPARTALALFLEPASGALAALSGYWLKVVTDAVVAGDRASAIRGVVGFVGFVGLAKIASAAWLRLVIRLGEQTGFAMEQRLAAAVADMPTLEIFERPEQLDRLDLLREQRDFYAYTFNAFGQGLREVARLVATLGLLASVDLRLLLLVPLGAPSLRAAVRARLDGDDVQLAVAERRRRADHLMEVATAPGPARELRVFGLAPQIAGRWEAAQASADAALIAREWQASLRSALAWLVFGAGFLAAIFLVLASAADGGASPGDVILVVTAAASLAGNLGGVANWTAQAAAAMRFLARYVQVTRFAEERARDLPGAVAPTRLDAGIRFRNVSFAYPGSGEVVLQGVDLLLPAGSTVALVGENGAGKTTLAKLLCRLYEPTGGQIEVDGKPLTALDITSWRASISAGFQDFARFELAARESVGVGDLTAIADDATVTAALTAAGADGVIGQLDDGLDTLLGRTWGGTDLSTGQWQLLALGRAMMRRRPLLLILDEPTASLDAEAEHRLFESYAEQSRRRAAEGAITVIVSHRFSTVRAADLIVVLDRGRIVEAGDHRSLMSAGGTYAELFTLQARAYRR